MSAHLLKYFFWGGSQLSPGLDFLENKSPVKIKIEYEEDYQSYVLRDRYLMTRASTSEVPYLFDPNKVAKPQQRAQSVKRSVKELSQHLYDKTTNKINFTVEGRIVFGFDEAKVLPFGTVIWHSQRRLCHRRFDRIHAN